MEKKITVWEKFLDFGKGWGLIVTMITLGTAFMVIVETRIFDSSEQKHEIIKAHEEGPTPEQKIRALIIDSINKTEAIVSRRKRDSILFLSRQDQVEIKETLKKQDSIILLNADQVYQIKEQLKNN